MINDVEKKVLQRVHILVEVRHIVRPSGLVFGRTRSLRVDIRPTRGCQHSEAFAEGPDPRHRGFGVGRYVFLPGLDQRVDTGITDVMQLVGDYILELRRRLLRIEIQEDCRSLKDKTVSYRLDDG